MDSGASDQDSDHQDSGDEELAQELDAQGVGKGLAKEAMLRLVASLPGDGPSGPPPPGALLQRQRAQLQRQAAQREQLRQKAQPQQRAPGEAGAPHGHAGTSTSSPVAPRRGRSAAGHTPSQSCAMDGEAPTSALTSVSGPKIMVDDHAHA